MLSLLKTSGLPIYLNENENMLAFQAPLLYARFGRKLTKDMLGLLYNDSGSAPEERYYDVYRNIRFAEHEQQLAKDTYCYDITFIMPGQINGECKKPAATITATIPCAPTPIPRYMKYLKVQPSIFCKEPTI